MIPIGHGWFQVSNFAAAKRVRAGAATAPRNPYCLQASEALRESLPRKEAEADRKNLLYPISLLQRAGRNQAMPSIRIAVPWKSRLRRVRFGAMLFHSRTPRRFPLRTPGQGGTA